MADKLIGFKNYDSHLPDVAIAAIDNGNGTWSLGLATAAGGSGVTVTGAVTISAALPAGENFIGQTGGTVAMVSCEFARAGGSAVYSIGDEIANSVTAGSVVLMEFANAVRVNGGTGYIVGVKITTNVKSLTPSIRLHLYNASNPTVAGDNALHIEKYADTGKRLGMMDMPAMTTAADTANSDMSCTTDFGGQTNGVHCVVAAAGTRSIWGLLETLTAFTPVAGQLFTVTLFIDWS